MGKNQHVVPHDDNWAVEGENNSKITATTKTKKEAIDTARKTSQNQHSELTIHNKDGKIGQKDSHGHDPHPPKG